MKFTVGKKSLLAELTLLQGIIERKSTIPILSNILIEAGDGITLTATDLDISMQAAISGDGITPGGVAVPARKLFDIVRSLPEAEIHFEHVGDKVKISCGGSRFHIVSHAKEHYPSIPAVSGTGVQIKADILHEMISRTIYAITQEESRYALNGALLLIQGQHMKLVTTDGHRLAMSGCEVEASEDVKVIIPRKALTELLKLTDEGTVEFSKDENHLFFKVGARNLTSRALAGQFPNYEMVIPKSNDKSITLKVDTISRSVSRAALMADDRSHGIKMEFEDGSIVMTSQTPDLGECHETVPIDYNGGAVSVKLNASYVLDFLSVVGTDSITIKLKDGQTPILFKPEGDHDYIGVVMPMRI